MDFFTYRISLDMNESTSQSFLNVRKSDSARKLLFTLSDNGKAYQIGSGCTAVFRAKKPDGTILYNNCSINGNVIEYELTNQTISAEGIVECEVTLYGNDGRQITSPRFNIVVNDTIYADDEVESQNEFTQLTQAILGANNLNIEVEKSGDGTAITITKKDGTSEQVIVSKIFFLNVFVITETEVVTNKTYAEIKAAIDAGDIIYITDKNGVVYVPQVAKTNTKIELLWLDSHEDRTYRWSAVVNSENAWSVTLPELVNTDRMIADLSEKVDKVTGKGLSTNDYTAADKAKVDAIPASPKYTDTVYDDTAVKNRLTAVENEVAGIEAGSSFSGSYNDLTDKPTIPDTVTEGTVSGWGFTKNTGTYSKPTGGIPKADLAPAVQTSLGKADSALQSHQSLAAYRTASAQDTIDKGKVDKVTGKGLSTNDYTNAAKAKVDAIPASPKYTDTVYNDTAVKNRLTAIENKENVTLTANTARISNVSCTAKYFPLLGMVFVRIYGKICADLNVGYDYDLFTVGSRVPDSNAALSVKCGKNAMALAKTSSSGSAIQIRPLESGINGYDVFITGFWFA